MMSFSRTAISCWILGLLIGCTVDGRVLNRPIAPPTPPPSPCAGPLCYSPGPSPTIPPIVYGVCELPANSISRDQIVGRGEIENPYQVYQNNLSSIAPLWENYSESHFVFCENLDFSELSLANRASLGEFSGSIDGRGHTLSNIWINRPDENGVGWIRLLAGGSLSHFTIAQSSIIGGQHVGLIAEASNNRFSATIQAPKISNLSILSSVTVKGTHRVGGLVGLFWSGLIDSIKSSATVSGTSPDGRAIGGLIGLIPKDTETSRVVSDYQIERKGFFLALSPAELKNITVSGQVTGYVSDQALTSYPLVSQVGGVIGRGFGVKISGIRVEGLTVRPFKKPSDCTEKSVYQCQTLPSNFATASDVTFPSPCITTTSTVAPGATDPQVAARVCSDANFRPGNTSYAWDYGGIAGELRDSSLEDITLAATVDGGAMTGGLAGSAYRLIAKSVTISKETEIYGAGLGTGGLVGYLNSDLYSDDGSDDPGTLLPPEERSSFQKIEMQGKVYSSTIPKEKSTGLSNDLGTGGVIGVFFGNSLNLGNILISDTSQIRGMNSVGGVVGSLTWYDNRKQSLLRSALIHHITVRSASIKLSKGNSGGRKDLGGIVGNFSSQIYLANPKARPIHEISHVMVDSNLTTETTGEGKYFCAGIVGELFSDRAESNVNYLTAKSDFRVDWLIKKVIISGTISCPTLQTSAVYQTTSPDGYLTPGGPAGIFHREIRKSGNIRGGYLTLDETLSTAKLIPLPTAAGVPTVGNYFLVNGLGNLYATNFQSFLGIINTNGDCEPSSDGKFSPNCWNDPKMLFGLGSEPRAYFDKTVTPDTSTQRNCYNKYAENQHPAVTLSPTLSFYQKFQCDQGRTTDELKDPATFAGWSTDDWEFEAGVYPRLKIRE